MEKKILNLDFTTFLKKKENETRRIFFIKGQKYPYLYYDVSSLIEDIYVITRSAYCFKDRLFFYGIIYKQSTYSVRKEIY